MKRHNSRILAMMTLYQHDIIEHTKIKEELEEDKILELETYNEITDELKDLDVDESLYGKLVRGVLNNISEIDAIISANLTKYPLDRLSYVDRAILRIATYEMKFTTTPKNIIIDEALKITEDYVDMEDFPAKRFNNKVLDSIKGYLNEQK